MDSTDYSHLKANVSDVNDILSKHILQYSNENERDEIDLEVD